MDFKFFELLQRFSRDAVQTAPPNQETLALGYMQRAYELGKDAGRAEGGRDRTDTNYQWHSDGSESGRESGLEP